jgi:hypothetical protein
MGAAAGAAVSSPVHVSVRTPSLSSKSGPQHSFTEGAKNVELTEINFSTALTSDGTPAPVRGLAAAAAAGSAGSSVPAGESAAGTANDASNSSSGSGARSSAVWSLGGSGAMRRMSNDNVAYSRLADQDS